MKTCLGFIFIFCLKIASLQAATTVIGARDIMNNNSCFNCHISSVSYGKFTDFTSDGDWVTSGYVIPGNADGSLFIKRIINAGHANSDMPQGGPALSAQDFSDLRDWINNMDPNAGSGSGTQSGGNANIDIGVDINSTDIQLQTFNRCYTHFTREKLPSSDPRIAQIQAGTKTAPDACAEILATANLQAGNGEIVDTPTGRAVLKTFHDFHISWFPARDFDDATTFSELNKIFESTQPANFVTKALFGNNGAESYNSIITGTSSPASIRYQANGSIKKNDPTFGFAQGAGIEYIDLGQIRGIREQAVHNITTARTSRFNSTPDNTVRNVFQNFGGGVIGSQAYIMLHASSRMERFSDGGMDLIRRHPEKIFEQFFCRKLPVIRPGDSTAYVNGSSALPFRGGNSCMQCHASMDRMARTARHLVFTLVDGVSNGTTNRRLPFVKNYPTPTEPQEVPGTWPDDDNDYFKRPPLGKLYYRDFNGNLIDEDVMGLDGLGNAIANQDAFYACAASRYFTFLTGVEINLDDMGNSNTPPLDKKDLQYREFVIDLGKQLRQDQSLQSLIRRIIASKAYVVPGLGVR